MRRLRAERKAAGLCPQCGKNRVEGPGACENCRARHRTWRAENRQRLRDQNKAKRERDKVAVFDHYGRECRCCGETAPEFLAIDHVNGDGAAHRKTVAGNFYSWVVRNGFPDFLRTLCHNCNMARGLYGYCPHEGR